MIVSGVQEYIVAALSEAGYQVSTDHREGMKAVLAYEPDVVILGADPPQLDCCDLLSEIKGSEHTRNIRVVMLSPGGSGKRTRGLDLGADDVLSLPFAHNDPAMMAHHDTTRSPSDVDVVITGRVNAMGCLRGDGVAVAWARATEFL